MATRTSANHLASDTRSGRALWYRQRVLVTGAILTLATSITVAVLLTGGGRQARDAEPAALPATSMTTALTVNGQPIPLRQVMLQVQADRAATFAYFQQHFGAGDTAGFWHARFGTTTPADYLIVHAVTDTVANAVERDLAHQHGLLADPGYPAFLSSWTEENTRRSTALAKHQVIYGPTRYSEAGYFTYLMGDLEPLLEKALVADGSIPESGTDAFHGFLASAAARATVVRATDVLSRIPLT